ncbi:organic hydroperoxide resistance protein [Roseomonas sp. USHLN139]|uniref:organic hydroperoxide resistance protein n=1 Tax=Roseomonas sp. USHLN139 TaxID=3081298 RepID=UPI003B0190A8
MKILYRARVSATGGREGAARSDDGLLAVKLAPPKELGGAGGATNPEQLFGAGYSACFLGAMKYVAGQRKISLPQDVAVAAEVGIGQREDGEGFGLEVALTVSLPAMEQAAAEDLVERAHRVCPYSHATRGNIPVTTTVAV